MRSDGSAPHWIVEKRVTTVYTYRLKAWTKREAIDLADDIGELRADEVSGLPPRFTAKETE